MCAKFGVGLNSKVCICQNLFSQQCEENMPPKKTQCTLKRKYLRISRLAVIFWTFQRQTAKAPLDIKAGLIERAVVGFCNTLINICQMKKGEWVKHMLFLYLQVPYDENITLGTREYGVQLNIITGLRKAGEQKEEK